MKKLVIFASIFSIILSCATKQNIDQTPGEGQVTAVSDSALAGKSPEQVIALCDERINKKEYYSAFKVLADYDVNNEIPDVQIKKVEVAINYFVKSLNHVMFAFKDFEEGDDMMALRGGTGSFPMMMFNVPVVFEELIKNNPDNFKLHKALGEYYYDASHRYSGRWIISDEEIVSAYMENLSTAYKNKVYDYYSLHALGEGNLINKKYKEALVYLLESVKLKPDYANAHYNAAYAYMHLNELRKAIKFAKKALELYKEPSLKADSARIIATAYEELKDYKNALTYYHKANNIQPNNYYTLRSLMYLELRKKKSSNINKILNDFLTIDPKNPTIYQDLLGAHKECNKLDKLIKFLESNKKKYAGNDHVTANLYFYIGSVFYELKKSDKCKENLLKSKEYFLKVYEPDHQVFGVIDKIIGEKK